MKNNDIKKYKILNKYIIDNRINKQNENTTYANQGICVINDEIYLTSYDTGNRNIFGKVINKEKSKIEILNKNNKKTLYLHNHSHVGGIAYDNKNNLIYICNNESMTEEEKEKYSGCIEIIDFNYIKELTNNAEIKNYKKKLLDLKASYITYSRETIYVGKFIKKGISEISVYDVNTFNKINTYKINASKIQGMCIYNYQGRDYHIFSSSYGRKSNSNLYITKLCDKEFIIISVIELPCLLEGITVKENTLMMIYESDCCKYSNGTDRLGKSTSKITDIICIDIEKLIKNINK